MKALAITPMLALHAPPAAACSCGSWSELTAAGCGDAKRAFAGEVAGYAWFDLRSLVVGRPRVVVELAVDRVWRGSVPDRLRTYTGHGGGDCGIHPPVGTRFVVCDDAAADAPPDFQLCSEPAFETPALEAALGPSRAPDPPAEVPARLAIVVLVLGCAAAWSRRT